MNATCQFINVYDFSWNSDNGVSSIWIYLESADRSGEICKRLNCNPDLWYEYNSMHEITSITGRIPWGMSTRMRAGFLAQYEYTTIKNFTSTVGVHAGSFVRPNNPTTIVVITWMKDASPTVVKASSFHHIPQGWRDQTIC